MGRDGQGWGRDGVGMDRDVARMDRVILGRSEAVKRGHVSPHPMIRIDPYLTLLNPIK